MKITIESEEFYRLKKELERANKEIHDLKNELSKFDEGKLKEKVLNNSFRLADLYLKGIFAKLGFDEGSYFDSALIDHENVHHWLGKDWYINERLKVNIHARISNEFRRAFIELGIVPAKVKEEDNILL